MNRPFSFFGQKYEENILGRDAFRLLMLLVAKIQTAGKILLYIDLLKAKF